MAMALSCALPPFKKWFRLEIRKNFFRKKWWSGIGQLLPREAVEPPYLEVFKRCVYVTWFSGTLFSVRYITGLKDLKGLF